MIVAQGQDVATPVSPVADPVAESEAKESEEKEDRWLLRPDSTLRLTWDMVIVTLILAQAVWIPLYVAFGLQMTDVTQGLEVTMTVILCLNIPVQFNTGYYHHGTLISHRHLIAIHYIKKRLLQDLFVFLPWNYLAFQQPHENDDIFYFSPDKILLIPRLFTLLKIPNLLKSLENLISTSFTATLLSLTKKTAGILLLGHYLACIWYIVAQSQGNWTNITWTISLRRERMYELDWREYYITAVYWTYTVLLTVGFGDIVPRTTAERLYATLCMLLSCGIFAFLLGSIGTLVSKQSAESDRYSELTRSMNFFMQNKRLPGGLRQRVRMFLLAARGHHQSNSISDQKIFSLLSAPLREEMSAYVHGAAIMSCKLFRGMSRTALALTGRCMKEEIFTQGDLLFTEGSVRAKLYYVVNGEVEIVHMRTNTLFRTLQHGAYFGHIGFFLKKTRCATAHSVGFVDVLTLDRDQLTDGQDKNEELEMILHSLQTKCANGDLSALHIHCYLCRIKGHVALNCKKEVVNAGGEILRSQWLARRKQSRTINLSVCQPNFERKARKVRPAEPSLSESLRKKIATFSTVSMGTQSIVLPQEQTVKPGAQPDWRYYFDSEGSDPGEMLSYRSE